MARTKKAAKKKQASSDAQEQGGEVQSKFMLAGRNGQVCAFCAIQDAGACNIMHAN
jgi:hypothetical protein